MHALTLQRAIMCTRNTILDTRHVDTLQSVGDVVEVTLKVPVADATVPTAVGRSIVIVGLSGPAAAQEGAMPVRKAATGGRTVCMFADGGGLTPKFVSWTCSSCAVVAAMCNCSDSTAARCQ